jgi:hypothetical protein
LAILYGVTTRRLNEQVRRNRKRFPDDFLFELTTEEFANFKSRFATSSWGGRRKRPLAFTEHGAIQAATILKSPRAVEMSVYVVRAFVKLREVLVRLYDPLTDRRNDLTWLGQGLHLAASAGVGSYGIAFHTKIARSAHRACNFMIPKSQCAPAVFFDSHRPLHFQPSLANASQLDS